MADEGQFIGDFNRRALTTTGDLWCKTMMYIIVVVWSNSIIVAITTAILVSNFSPKVQLTGKYVSPISLDNPIRSNDSDAQPLVKIVRSNDSDAQDAQPLVKIVRSNDSDAQDAQPLVNIYHDEDHKSGADGGRLIYHNNNTAQVKDGSTLEPTISVHATTPEGAVHIEDYESGADEGGDDGRHPKIDQQLNELLDLGCNVTKIKVNISDFSNFSDSACNKTNYEPKEVVIFGCVEKTTHCRLDACECLPDKDSVKPKTIAVTYEDEYGFRQYCEFEILEYTRCKCQNKLISSAMCLS